MVEICVAGATIGALTKMIRDAKQSNKYREFKITLHCTEQPIIATTLVKAL